MAAAPTVPRRGEDGMLLPVALRDLAVAAARPLQAMLTVCVGTPLAAVANHYRGFNTKLCLQLSVKVCIAAHARCGSGP
jgi:hypothetical protein